MSTSKERQDKDMEFVNHFIFAARELGYTVEIAELTGGSSKEGEAVCHLTIQLYDDTGYDKAKQRKLTRMFDKYTENDERFKA